MKHRQFKSGLNHCLGLLAVAFILSILILIPAQVEPLLADETTEAELQALRAAQAELGEQMRQAQERLALFQSQKEMENSDLDWLMERSEQQKAAYEEKLKQLAGIAKLQQTVDKDLEVALKRYNRTKENYGKRLEAMYQLSNQTSLEQLLQSKSLTAYLTTRRLMKWISDADEQSLRDLRTQCDELVQKRQDVENQLADMEKIRQAIEQDLEDIQQGIEESQNSTSQLDVDLQQMLEAVNRYVAKDDDIQGGIEALEARLAQEQAAREAALQAQNAGQTPSNQGAAQGAAPQGYTGVLLHWPAPTCGEISSPFSYRNIPEAGINDFHTGIDIPAQLNDPAVAAAPGTVIFTDWMEYGGKTVKIDIGGGLMIMYCHLNDFAVSVGETVTVGQTVGYVGSTGYSTGPHLHFEVQQDGVPVDPMGFLG